MKPSSSTQSRSSGSESAHSRGSKDVLGDIGVSPRGQVLKIPTLPGRVSPLRMRRCPNPRLQSCTKGDLIVTLTGEAGFVLGIPL